MLENEKKETISHFHLEPISQTHAVIHFWSLLNYYRKPGFYLLITKDYKGYHGFVSVFLTRALRDGIEKYIRREGEETRGLPFFVSSGRPLFTSRRLSPIPSARALKP